VVDTLGHPRWRESLVSDAAYDLYLARFSHDERGCIRSVESFSKAGSAGAERSPEKIGRRSSPAMSDIPDSRPESDR